MPTDAPSISAAESVVMEVIWKAHPITTEEILAALQREQDWQVSTVKTLLSRLMKKGALRAEKDGRRHLYSPALKRDEWLARESESLLDRLFGGKVAPFVAHFSKHGKLGRKDLAELKQLIDELDER